MSDKKIVLQNLGGEISFPEKIGKYQIISILGEGGMGVVYKAIDPDITQEVALKVIHPRLLKNDSDGTFLKRFRNEVLACRRLKHTNIVATYDYHEDANICFIVMEYIEGNSLSDLLNNKQVFDFPLVYKIMQQLLAVLSYAHAQGVIHRDIKPDNIMVKVDGIIHIMDFGIARMSTSTLTVAGTIMGAPGYMSPEQCTGQTVDNRSDIFSAGVVLYQLITNEKPFTGENPMAIMQKTLSVDPIKVSALNFHITPVFDLIISKALAKKPKDRYQTADAFMEDIDKYYQNELKPKNNSTIKSWALLTVGIAVALIAFASFFLKDKFGNDVIVTPEVILANITNGEINNALTKEFRKFDCNTLKVTLDPTNEFMISGSVLSTDITRLNSVLNAQFAEDKFTSTANTLDRPFCEIVKLLSEGVELNIAAGTELDIQPYLHATTYVDGEFLKFELIVPDSVYVYADYFSSDGSVLHLYPSSNSENIRSNESVSIMLGGSIEQNESVELSGQWEVVEPYGQDLITIISYPEALFDPLRPSVENTRDYLKVLKEKISTLSGKKRVKAGYFFITTKSK